MTNEIGGLAVVAHELKSPLVLMRQLALSMDFSSDSQKELERSKNQLISISERAIRQVNDLTRIARLDDGLFSMEPIAIRSICDEVYTELSHSFTLSSRALKLSYRNRTNLVIANHDLLFSVIYNFCINAMYYSTVDTVSELSLSDRSDCVEISVRDYGPALPKSIWTAFKQGFSTPTSIAMRPGSSGLGLYIASKFSKYMNSDLSAVRHHDGTSFKVKIPASKQILLPF